MKKVRFLFCIIVALTLAGSPVGAKEYHVSVKGMDNNPGTEPLMTTFSPAAAW